LTRFCEHAAKWIRMAQRPPFEKQLRYARKRTEARGAWRVS
jgi:hypothetical protein